MPQEVPPLVDGFVVAKCDLGGLIGITVFPPFLNRGVESTVDVVVEAIDGGIDRVGEEQVDIGSEFTQGWGPDFFDRITHDKDLAREPAEFRAIVTLEGIRTIGEFSSLACDGSTWLARATGAHDPRREAVAAAARGMGCATRTVREVAVGAGA